MKIRKNITAQRCLEVLQIWWCRGIGVPVRGCPEYSPPENSPRKVPLQLFLPRNIPPMKSMHGNNVVWLCAKYAVDANLFRLKSSILTRAKRATNRNNVGGNISWGNIPGWTIPGEIFRGGGVYLEPNNQRSQNLCCNEGRAETIDFSFFNSVNIYKLNLYNTKTEFTSWHKLLEKSRKTCGTWFQKSFILLGTKTRTERAGVWVGSERDAASVMRFLIYDGKAQHNWLLTATYATDAYTRR